MRSRRWVLAVGAAVMSAVVTVGTGGAAQAVAAFGPVQTVGKNCYFGSSVTRSTGTTRGVMGCDTADGDTELVLFRNDGTSSWKQIPTGVLGFPLAFADDGTSSFVVYQPETATGTKIRLFTRNRTTGEDTDTKLLSSAADWMAGAAIVAKGGKYWAAISKTNDAEVTTVYTRQTLDPSLPAMKPVKGTDPALALRGSKRVTMVVGGLYTSSTGHIDRLLPKTDGSWARKRIRTGDAFVPTVQYSGGVTRIAWQELTDETNFVFRVMYADNASGSFTRTTIPGSAAFPMSPPQIIKKGGTLTVGWTARNAKGGLSWLRAGVAQRVSGKWTSRSVGHKLDFAGLSGLGVVDGKVVTLMSGFAASGTTKVTARRQP